MALPPGSATSPPEEQATPWPSGSPNDLIAERLREAADLLEQQGANLFRVRAFRQAGDTVAGLGEDLRDVLQRGGVEGLAALPAIGPRIAEAIRQMLTTGRWGQLDRLRGTLEPEGLFRLVPGIGPELARRIHDTLHVDTLPALENAAHDGRLASVPGIGPRRAAMVRASLATMLGRPRSRMTPAQEPPVEMILDVDREYREKAEGQRTVVTETQGELRGRRVVRGREADCVARYDRSTPCCARPAGE